MSIFISDIIEDIITNIDNELKAVTIGIDFIIFKDIKWIELYNSLYFVLENNDLHVLDFLSVDKITNKVTFAKQINFNFTKIIMPSAFYLAGTRYATNSEWLSASDREVDKLPLIWLSLSQQPREMLTNTNTKSKFSSQWDNVQLFFLDNFDSLNWITKDKIENKILPLRKLANAFINTIDEMTCCYEREGKLTLTYYPIFGVESMNGIEKRIIDSDLTAVGLNLKINIKC